MLFLLFLALSQGSASVSSTFRRLNFAGIFGGQSSGDSNKQSMENRRLTFDDDLELSQGTTKSISKNKSSGGSNKRSVQSRRPTLDSDLESSQRTSDDDSEPSEETITKSTSNSRVTESQKTTKSTKSTPKNRTTESRQSILDDAIDFNQQPGELKIASSNKKLQQMFMENLLKQKENQRLHNELLEMHKAKLSIELETSKLEFERKKLEFQAARELTANDENSSSPSSLSPRNKQ